MDNVQSQNKECCEIRTVEAWAAWFEGEEGWGVDDD